MASATESESVLEGSYAVGRCHSSMVVVLALFAMGDSSSLVLFFLSRLIIFYPERECHSINQGLFCLTWIYKYSSTVIKGAARRTTGTTCPKAQLLSPSYSTPKELISASQPSRQN